MTRSSRWRFVLSALATVLGGCSEDGDWGASPSSGGVADARADTGTADGTGRDTRSESTHDVRADRTIDASRERDAIDERPPIVQRGEYLVKHVAICSECHTPSTADGSPDHALFLTGAPGRFRVPGLGPDGGDGLVSPKNLTPDRDTGLGAWTDAEIKRAFLDGIDKDGKALSPLMPYYVLHNMSEEDANAVVAYLRTIPAVRRPIAARNFEVPAPSAPMPAAMIPDPALEPADPNYASAMRGKYLAGNIGLCMDCHTEHVTEPVPLARDKLFAGGRTFVAAGVGIPSPPFPSLIYSANITPHPSGLEGWTAAAVAALLKQGIDDDGVRICPPMPIGPMGAFGGLTERDARDIGNYIVYLPPTSNVIPVACHDEITRDGGPSGR